MKTWNVEDFITYLYHIVVDADFDTNASEVDMLKRRVGKLVLLHYGIKDYSYEDSIKKIKGTLGNSVISRSDLIKTMVERFQLPGDIKSDILSDLNDIALSDDNVSATEHETISHIRQLIMIPKTIGSLRI